MSAPSNIENVTTCTYVFDGSRRRFSQGRVVSCDAIQLRDDCEQTRIVQQRLSTREAKMENEERSMLVSMTRTLFPGKTRREVSFDGQSWSWVRSEDEHAHLIPVQRMYSQSVKGEAVRVALTSAC